MINIMTRNVIVTVSKIIKAKFQNLSVEETINLSTDIIDAINKEINKE